MSKPTIVVTGSSGQLGRELRDASVNLSEYQFIFATRQELPIEEPEQVRLVFQRYQPVYCINCAAYTAVDKAESERDRAFLVNAESVGILSGTCQQFGTKLLHISTDYVFDGNSAVPLKETDPTGPINMYGASKLEGERLALLDNDDTLILRTSWVYSAYGNNFVKTMIRLMGERPSLNVINDQVGSPTYAADLARMILQIIAAGKFIPGIYHYSNEGEISWFDFASAIRDMTGSSCEIRPIPTSQYPTPARRPRFSLLDKTKNKYVYAAQIPFWRDSLEKCLSQMKKQEA